MNSFIHPAWLVKDIETSTGYIRSVRTAKDGANRFSALYYTITMRRHASYYLYTAIGPTVLVTIVAYFSLFISEMDPRMATVVTCLLTIMAVQWIVSGYIPITNDNPWIMRFCTSCEAYVGVICVLSFFVSYVEVSKVLLRRIVTQLFFRKCSTFINGRIS